MERPNASNMLLAFSTLLAAIFVAVQAWYARNSFVEATNTRLLEKKLEICFENFDDAAGLDMAMRTVFPDMATQEDWPPKVRVANADTLAAMQREIVPMLDAFESGLTKASVLGGLDKYRGYLAQQLRGLSKGVMDITPGKLQPEYRDERTDDVLDRLSEFLGAQYSVFTGCRLVAEGQA